MTKQKPRRAKIATKTASAPAPADPTLEGHSGGPADPTPGDGRARGATGICIDPRCPNEQCVAQRKAVAYPAASEPAAHPYDLDEPPDNGPPLKTPIEQVDWKCVPCPKCGAAVGEDCAVGGGWRAPHNVRVKAVLAKYRADERASEHAAHARLSGVWPRPPLLPREPALPPRQKIVVHYAPRVTADDIRKFTADEAERESWSKEEAARLLEAWVAWKRWPELQAFFTEVRRAVPPEPALSKEPAPLSKEPALSKEDRDELRAWAEAPLAPRRVRQLIVRLLDEVERAR